MCPHSTASGSTDRTDDDASERTERARVSVNTTAAEKAAWEAEAAAVGRSLSSFVKTRVRAGVKKFDASVAPDEGNEQLRRSRDEWRSRATAAEARVDELERTLESTDRGAFADLLRDRNAPLPWSEAVDALRAGTPGRVKGFVDSMAEVRAELPAGASEPSAASVVASDKRDEGAADAPDYVLYWEGDR